MINAIRNWYIRNQDEITWFLIGWLSFAGLDALTEGRYISAGFSLGFAYINYAFRKIRL